MEISDKVKEALELYASLMEDTKERLEIIGTTAHMEGMPPKYVTEFCTLQFRMICENIALGCLLAHGDVGSLQINNKLRQDKWHAGELMTVLNKLHPAFFPRPHVLTRPEGRPAHFESVPSSVTKEVLTEFYGRTGDTLHRGTLVDRWNGKATRPYTREEIMATGQAIVDFLKVHLITLVDGTVLGCILRDSGRQGRVNAFVAGHVPPPESEQKAAPQS
jgi:hypothetical protein